MASADQLKALLKSHIEGDDQRFFSVAMQVAAQEAKLGHGKLAEELRFLVHDAKRRQGIGQPTQISRPRGELANLLSVSYPKARLSDMVLDKSLEQQIQRIIREQRHATRILAHGPRRVENSCLLGTSPVHGKDSHGFSACQRTWYSFISSAFRWVNY